VIDGVKDGMVDDVNQVPVTVAATPSAASTSGNGSSSSDPTATSRGGLQEAEFTNDTKGRLRRRFAIKRLTELVNKVILNQRVQVRVLVRPPIISKAYQEIVRGS
jgi:hypothetical protein